MRWPEGFMWGTGASSTQCEGAAPASDWWDWERAGHAPLSGDGNGFATRHAEDFALLAGLGLTHHRLSIEWARVEPEPGRRDPAVVEHYREVLQAARDEAMGRRVLRRGHPCRRIERDGRHQLADAIRRYGCSEHRAFTDGLGECG